MRRASENAQVREQHLQCEWLKDCQSAILIHVRTVAGIEEGELRLETV